MIYFFNNTLALQDRVTIVLGCVSGSLPLMYLGLPLTIKEVTPTFWNTILKRIQRKLARWKGSILSHAGNYNSYLLPLKGSLFTSSLCLRSPYILLRSLKKFKGSFYGMGLRKRKNLLWLAGTKSVSLNLVASLESGISYAPTRPYLLR